MDQASQVTLVEEPGAHAGSREPMYAGQVDTALFQCAQHRNGVVGADQADTPHPGPPERRPQSPVHDGAAGLTHAGATVGKDEVVDQEVPEEDKGGRHGRYVSRAKALASDSTAVRSSGLFQIPPCFSDDPTMNPCASAKRARFWTETPEPTITGRRTARAVSRTSSGEASSPLAGPVTTTPSARKSSAALAVSTSDTSPVMACALCFFLMSANTKTRSAPIARR